MEKADSVSNVAGLLLSCVVFFTTATAVPVSDSAALHPDSGADTIASSAEENRVDSLGEEGRRISGETPVGTNEDTSSGQSILLPVVMDSANGTVLGRDASQAGNNTLRQRLLKAMGGGRALAALRRYTLRGIMLLLSILLIVSTILFFRQKSERRRFMTTTRLAIMDKEVQRACRHIEKHFDDPTLSLQSICAELVTGEAFLEALFEQELGMSVLDFISQVRVNRAKHILNKDPDYSPEQLAAETGFGNRDNLETTFLNVAGAGVEEYGDSIRGGTFDDHSR